METRLGVFGGGPFHGAPFSQLFTSTCQLLKTEDVQRCTHLLLWGGEDISPSLYGEWPNRHCEGGLIPSKRDQFEWSCLKLSQGLGIKTIGVCRGAQLLCAFDGGRLAQDIGGHSSGHNIRTKQGEVLWTQGNHHQMMMPRDNAEILATVDKQLTELYIDKNNAITYFPKGFLEPEVVHFPEIKAVGFQYHPEWGDVRSRAVTYTLEVVDHYLK